MNKYKPGTYDSVYPIQYAENRNGNVTSYAESGISKRLYIAVEAMKVLIARPGTDPEEDIKLAYKIADIMLAQEYEGTQIEEAKQ